MKIPMQNLSNGKKEIFKLTDENGILSTDKQKTIMDN